MRKTLFRLVTFTVLCLALCCSGGESYRAIEIIEAEEQLELPDLWPGFEPLKVPVAIFDGQRTVLARHPSPPKEFKPLPGHDGIWIYDGRHPMISACTSGEIAGVRTALVMVDPAQDTAVEKSAAVLVHESFHAFAGARHPDWGANEMEAFLYPVEDTLGLALRRLEVESLKRALAAGNDTEAQRWSAGALDIRKRRFARLTPGQSNYERGIELFEGTAFYVENRSLGDAATPPLEESGYGPEQIRRRAYDTGRAVCILLDRLAPGWKERLEGGPAVPLDSLLTEAVHAARVSAHEIPDTLFREELLRAEDDIAAILEGREREREEFLGAGGWVLEIVGDDTEKAFWSVGFDPMNLRRVSGDEMLHNRMLKLSGSSGTFEAMDRKVLTKAVGDHPMFSGICRVVVTGLDEEPEIHEQDGQTIIEAEGISACLNIASIERHGKCITLTMR